MRGVTPDIESIHIRPVISTHTPHARRDGENLTQEITLANFNSHASCEA